MCNCHAGARGRTEVCGWHADKDVQDHWLDFQVRQLCHRGGRNPGEEVPRLSYGHLISMPSPLNDFANYHKFYDTVQRMQSILQVFSRLCMFTNWSFFGWIYAGKCGSRFYRDIKIKVLRMCLVDWSDITTQTLNGQQYVVAPRSIEALESKLAAAQTSYDEFAAARSDLDNVPRTEENLILKIGCESPSMGCTCWILRYCNCDSILVDFHRIELILRPENPKPIMLITRDSKWCQNTNLSYRI